MTRTDNAVNAQVPVRLANALYKRADEKIAAGEQTFAITDHQDRNAAAIRVLAAHIASASLEDARLHGLAAALRGLGDPGSAEVHWGSQQRRVIETLGLERDGVGQKGAAVDADMALTALTAAGAEDLTTALVATRETLSHELTRLRDAQDELRQRASRADDLEQQRSEERARFEQQLREAARGQWQREQQDPFAERRAVAIEQERQHFDPPANVKDGQKVDGESGIYWVVRDGKPAAFGCRFPRAGQPGKTDSKEPFATVEDAKAYRKRMLAAAHTEVVA